MDILTNHIEVTQNEDTDKTRDQSSDEASEVVITGAESEATSAEGTTRAAQPTSFGAVFELSTLLVANGGDGSNGFFVTGTTAPNGSGFPVASAGDINNDGIDDLIFGASTATPNGFQSGESYVVFGSDQGFSASIDVSLLDGSNGFVLFGTAPRDVSGASVATAGDVNNDGIADLIIGAIYLGDQGIVGSGGAHVVFGTDQGFAANVELSSFDAVNGGDGSNGFVINGIEDQDSVGSSVASAGDINGDGIDDMIIGAPGGDPNGPDSGETYVIFGSDQGFAANLALSSLDGSNGFVINGLEVVDLSGRSVSSAGDFNGDGIDDMIIGARGGSSLDNDPGQAYVIFGSDQGFAANIEISTLDGSDGFIIIGIDPGDRAGQSVASAGDINGDGLDDIIIGAPFANPNGNVSGETYVIFGSDQGFTDSFDLTTLDGSNGFVLNGAQEGQLSGNAVAAAGDVNNDGIDDLLIGAQNGNQNTGQAYVVYGSTQVFSASIDLSSIDGTNGFVLNGVDVLDRTGFSVAGAGDVNGDGIDDLVIGNRASSEDANAFGGSYVVFGRGEHWVDTFERADGGTSQAGVTRTASLHANTTEGTDDGDADYSVRTDQAGVTGLAPFSGVQGGFLWAAEDIDGIDALGGSDFDVIDWTGIDVENLAAISFSGYFGAASNDGSSDYRFGSDDFISVQVQIDGGGYTEIIRFESDEFLSSSAGEMRQDTNGDGVGDGLLLTEALQHISNVAIAGTGTTLDLRLVFHAEGDDAALGFDNFAINASNIAAELAEIEVGDIIYQETGGPQIITSTLTVTDADDINIEGATIAIIDRFDAANDVLAFTDANGITGSYNAGTGILTLTGTATVAQYQSALRSITYENAFTTESTATRTFSFTVNDGFDDSNTVSRDTGFNVDETINGTPGPDQIGGGFGSDTINGLGDNDRLFGQDGNDIINGGDGDDQLWGMTGADALDGGAGTDGAFYVTAGAGVAFNAVTGGTGGEATGDTYTDIEYFHGSLFADMMDGGAGDDLFYGRNGDDMMNGGGGADRLYGQTGNDTINGDGGDDSIYGGSGNDILGGGAGEDLISGGTGNDTVNGDAADDVLYGNDGIDTLNGGDGVDTLYGGNDGDILNGDGDNDNLFGEAGDDTLNGGDGADALRGGSGANTVNGDGGNDIIYAHQGVDTVDGGMGLDRIIYSLANAGVDASLMDSSFNTGAAAGDTYVNVENLYGSQFNDSLIGDNGVNVLSGLSGADVLNGFDGNDRLFGGNDDDVLIGGLGNDIMFGGSGADTFSVSSDDHGADRIFDWTDGSDIIEYFNVNSTVSTADLTITQVGANVLIELFTNPGDGTILVLNALAENFDETDFRFFQVIEDTNETPNDKKLSQDDLAAALQDGIQIAETMTESFDALQPEAYGVFDFDAFM